MSEPAPYILLIDDDDDDLEMLSSSLELLNVKVKTFQSGEKALFYLTLMSGNGEQPALIIMDYNMPVNNGQQILVLLKSNVDTKGIPVAIYSTTISAAYEKILLNLGAVGCFIKSFTYSDFTTQVCTFRDLAYSFTTNNNLV